MNIVVRNVPPGMVFLFEFYIFFRQITVVCDILSYGVFMRTLFSVTASILFLNFMVLKGFSKVA